MAKSAPENQPALPLSGEIGAMESGNTCPLRPDNMPLLHYEVVVKAWPLITSRGEVLTDPWEIFNAILAREVAENTEERRQRGAS